MDCQTFIILKPDAVKRGLVGEILARFERKGFRIDDIWQDWIRKETLEQQYYQHRHQPWFNDQIDFMRSGPVVAVLLGGPAGTIETVRKMIGATHGMAAEPGTIRGDYGIHQRFNLIHASDSQEAYERETNLYFHPERPRKPF